MSREIPMRLLQERAKLSWKRWNREECLEVQWNLQYEVVQKRIDKAFMYLSDCGCGV